MKSTRKIIAGVLIILLITLLLGLLHNFLNHGVIMDSFHSPIRFGPHNHSGVVVDPQGLRTNDSNPEEWQIQVFKDDRYHLYKRIIKIREDVDKSQFSIGDTIYFKHGLFRPKLIPERMDSIRYRR